MENNILDDINFNLARLNDIKVYSHNIDKLVYDNLIEILNLIKEELETNTSSEDNMNIIYINNASNIKYILDKYKHTATSSHHFF